MKVAPQVLRRVLSVVSLTVFLDMLGFGIIVPILPLIILKSNHAYSLFPESTSLEARYVMLGILIALFPLTQLFATPVLGDLSDTIGRKKVLIFSIVGTFFSYVLTLIGLFTLSFPILLIARAIDGVSGGNLSVAQAVVADVSTPKTRARNFAILSAAFGLGFILGPLLGARLTSGFFYTRFGLSAPFWIALLLSAINVFILMIFMTETKKKVAAFSRIYVGTAARHIRRAISMPGIRLFFAANFLLQGSFAVLTAFLSVFLLERIGIHDDQFGFVLSYLGLWMALGQIFLVKTFAKRFGELRAFYISLVGLTASIFILYLPQSLAGFLVVTPFVSLFLGLSQAFVLSLVSGSVSESMQGEVLGINTSVTALAQTIPPIIAGMSAALFFPGTPILLAACISLGASFIVRRRVKAMS